MDKALKKKIEEIQKLLDAVAIDKRYSREQYREFLEEVGCHIDVSLEVLDEDEKRDAARVPKSSSMKRTSSRLL
jgi:hypothetical protein